MTGKESTQVVLTQATDKVRSLTQGLEMYRRVETCRFLDRAWCLSVQRMLKRRAPDESDRLADSQTRWAEDVGIV